MINALMDPPRDTAMTHDLSRGAEESPEICMVISSEVPSSDPGTSSFTSRAEVTIDAPTPPSLKSNVCSPKRSIGGDVSLRLFVMKSLTRLLPPQHVIEKYAIPPLSSVQPPNSFSTALQVNGF